MQEVAKKIKHEEPKKKQNASDLTKFLTRIFLTLRTANNPVPADDEVWVCIVGFDQSLLSKILFTLQMFEIRKCHPPEFRSI